MIGVNNATLTPGTVTRIILEVAYRLTKNSEFLDNIFIE